MNALDQLRKLSSAEDFFDTLGVEYDPAVVRVARLHILRRMGEYLYHSGAHEGTEDEIWLACRSFLKSAYDDFCASSPIAERVFKVHKDAVKPKEAPTKPFVSLNAVAAPTSQG